jgi:hypothetical protein
MRHHAAGTGGPVIVDYDATGAILQAISADAQPAAQTRLALVYDTSAAMWAAILSLRP